MNKGKTAIIDYGVGNLFSLRSGLREVGADSVVTANPEELKNAARIILPGVGAFGDAAKKLRDLGLVDIIREEARNGKPFLGICLGMQLLFEKSYEYGEHDGLALIPGSVVPLSGAIRSDLKIPHIGWNKLDVTDAQEPIYRYLPENAYVYYVHSYYAKTEQKYITATSEYDIPVTGSVRLGSVIGTQFHPEKSGKTGMTILKAFCAL